MGKKRLNVPVYEADICIGTKKLTYADTDASICSLRDLRDHNVAVDVDGIVKRMHNIGEASGCIPVRIMTCGSDGSMLSDDWTRYGSPIREIMYRSVPRFLPWDWISSTRDLGCKNVTIHYGIGTSEAYELRCRVVKLDLKTHEASFEDVPPTNLEPMKTKMKDFIIEEKQIGTDIIRTDEHNKEEKMGLFNKNKKVIPSSEVPADDDTIEAQIEQISVDSNPTVEVQTSSEENVCISEKDAEEIKKIVDDTASEILKQDDSPTDFSVGESSVENNETTISKEDKMENTENTTEKKSFKSKLADFRVAHPKTVEAIKLSTAALAGAGVTLAVIKFGPKIVGAIKGSGSGETAPVVE